MDEISILSKAMSEAISPDAAAGWLGGAAVKGMLAGAAGTGTAAALSALGIGNPMAQGAIGSAVSAAASAAGLGGVGSALGSVLSGGLGGAPDALATALANGGFAGPANQAAGALGGMVVKDEIPKSVLDNFDPSAVGAQAMDQAAGQLMAQWKVDDDASAGEQVAHKLVADNMSSVTDAAKQSVFGDGKVLEGLKKKIDAIFSGATSKAADPVARMGDKDVKPPYIIQVGVANILAQGKPISRITDPLTPSGPVIAEGSPTVLSAGLPTAHLKSATSPPAMMILEGAPTVLVFVPPPKVAPPAKPPEAKKKENEGPKKPDAPKDTKSNSSTEGDGGQGNQQQGEAGNKTEEQSGQTGLMCEMPENSTGSIKSEETACTPVSVSLQGDWHRVLVVEKDGKFVSFEGQPDSLNIFDANLSVEEHDSDPLHPFLKYELNPPPGMSASEFANAVIAAGRNAAWNSKTLEYAVAGGGGIQDGTANSNSIIREILKDAGYKDYIPIIAPGINVGVNPPCPPGWPLVARSPVCDTGVI
jgi:hypothetical protein